MELIEIFQVLGIAETKDENIIKKAYRTKLAVTNPEDNPEGFKRLRTAYEEACRYAKQSDEETEEGAAQEEIDTTPSGLWVAKVAEIYGRIDTRRDVECWKKLFAEDIFLSLEEEENCRMKLLRFVMEHYRLPSQVWTLLNEKLNIVDEAAGLREKFPADFVNYIVAKCQRGEDVDFSLFEGAPDGAYDLFISYYDQCWRALKDNQLEQAAQYIQNADELQIFHPIMEICRADLMEKQGNADAAVEHMSALRERFPEDVTVGYNAAEFMWRNDRKEAAAAIYQALKRVNKKHYMANARLAEWLYSCGDYKKSKECIEEILSMGVDEGLRELLVKVNRNLEKDLEETFRKEKDWRAGIDLCWCYLQDGKVTKGSLLAASLETEIPAESRAEYNGLLTKLYVESAEYEACITMAEVWEKSLYEKLLLEQSEEDAEKDKDRLRQSHAIRMQCYRALGYADEKYFAEAIREAELIEEKNPGDIGTLLEKAQVYMEMGEYEKSLDVVRRLTEDYQVYAAQATAQDVYRRMWNAQGVVQSGRMCIYYFPNYVRAYEQTAKVYLDLKYTEDLKNLLEEAKNNNVESPMLEAYRYQMDQEVPDEDVLNAKVEEFRKNYMSKAENGEQAAYEEGLPLITEYLYWYPGSYMLVERGLFHKAANHMEAAIADFEKALIENPGNPYALNALHQVYKLQGDFERAMICLRRAILYFGSDRSAAVFADKADLYSLMGHFDMALASWREFMDATGERVKKNAYYMTRMAESMAHCGQLEEALTVLENAYDDRLDMYHQLVMLCQEAALEEKDTEYLEFWHKTLQASSKFVGNREYAKYYTMMAWHELLFGTGTKAVDYFEKLLECKVNDNSINSSYCDMIFACILTGDDERGKHYSAKLREWRDKQQKEGRTIYFKEEKGRLNMDLMADYYVKSTEELEQMLAGEEKCQICYFCTKCVCKELEGARILVMLRKGETEEAFARLQANLERQSLDEYMHAIRHIRFAGQNGDADEKPAAGEVLASEREAEADNAQKKGLLTKFTGLFGGKK